MCDLSMTSTFLRERLKDIEEIGRLMKEMDALEQRAVRLAPYVESQNDLEAFKNNAAKAGKDAVKVVMDLMSFLEDYREWERRRDAIKQKTEDLDKSIRETFARPS